MSYVLSEALQIGIYNRLGADAEVQRLSAGAVFDAMPAGTVPDLYVALGPEEARQRADVSGVLSEHDVVISVVTASSGFRQGKALAAAISACLTPEAMVLTAGSLVSLNFHKARAYRVGTGEIRRIDLTFRAVMAE